jgi:hypothetical protein
VNGYADWLRRQPTDDTWPAWQAEGRAAGYLNGPDDGPALRLLDMPSNGTATRQHPALAETLDAVVEHLRRFVFLGRDAQYDAIALWVRAVLDRTSRWFAKVRDLLHAGMLGFSSGSLMHLVQVGPDGEIQRWPLVEMSLTPSPASADARVYTVKASDAVGHYAAAGLPVAGVKALTTAPELPHDWRLIGREKNWVGR